MIKTCFFDMGNVLVFFSHNRMCEQIAALYDVSTDRIVDALMNSGLQNQLETGTLAETDFRDQFNALLGGNVELTDLKRAAADIFWANEPILPILRQLKANGMRLVLLSNTSAAHFEFIHANFEILQLFDDYTVSYGCHSMKPDAGIYEDALSRAQCAASECFFTDDLQDNIDRAREFGINAEQFIDVPKLVSDLSALGVSSLT